MSEIPRSVLADALRAELDGATLRAAVLTSFTFDWDFTVDEVLPVFVPHDLSAHPVTRREELAQHLQQDQVAITAFVDARHPGEASGASRVPLAVVPVRHPTGCFHPKVILALVTDDAESERLVVGVGSANLTRAGWWEWVECAHLWSIEDKAATWCRDDLLSFLEHLEKRASTANAKAATKQIRAFLAQTQQRLRASAGDSTRPERFHWNGLPRRPSFVDGLVGFVQDYYQGGTLEVLSPWYSDSGDAQLREVAAGLGVASTVVLTPTGPDGHARIDADAVARLGDDVSWATLPTDVTSGGDKDAARRNVHAKVYRLRQPRQHMHTVVVGSVNLTPQAFHSAQNLEAAVFVDCATGGKKAWLEPTTRPTAFADPPALDDEGQSVDAVLSPLSLTYDWLSGEASAAWAERLPTAPVDVYGGGLPVLRLDPASVVGALPQQDAASLGAHLRSSSPLLHVRETGGDEAYTFVTELHVERKPTADLTRSLADAVADLLLSREQRRLRGTTGGREDAEDGQEQPAGEAPQEQSVFETQAALYQGLSALTKALLQLAEDGKDNEIRYRLTARGARCVGDLLDVAARQADEDPAGALVVCWGLEDVLLTCRPRLKGHRKDVDQALLEVNCLRERLEAVLVEANQHDTEMKPFLDWARRSFTKVPT